MTYHADAFALYVDTHISPGNGVRTFKGLTAQFTLTANFGGSGDNGTVDGFVRNFRLGAVSHGFRSSFRDWAAECSDAPRDVCELALAHVNSDRVEAGYRRTDLFERRRFLMQEWAAYLA